MPLPDEYQPFKLSPIQQQMHARYCAMGFRISQRPFACVGEQLYFFASRPEDQDTKQNYTINLQAGSLKVIGEELVLTASQAELRFRSTSGERSAVSPPNPPPAVAAEPPLPPPVESQQQQPASEQRGLTDERAPVKSPATKRKQTALF